MQVTPTGETVIVPRNFKLLEELEKMEKGNTEMAISFGLVDGADVLMSNWNGGILGPHNTQHDGRFYELRIYCPESYPASPPEVKFVSKINMTCVDSKTGKVNFRKVNTLPKQWNRNMGIEQILVALRHEMQLSENRKLKQPAEGTVF